RHREDRIIRDYVMFSEDLRPAPLEQRKGKLEKLLAHNDGIRFSEHIAGEGATIFAHACKFGFEGIVSKRRDLPYRSGRAKCWIKIKNPASPAGPYRLCVIHGRHVRRCW